MKKIRLIYIIIFALLIITPTAYMLATPDKDYSENENRYLQTRPQLSISSFMDKTLQDDITSYVSDQFPLRDKLMQTTTVIKKLLGYKDIGGVYLGNDNYYFEKITDDDVSLSKFAANLSAFDKFTSENNINAHVMLIPSSGNILKDKLPAGASVYDGAALTQKAMDTLSHAKLVDVTSALKSAVKDERAVYYKTDHHWTTYGAYVGYKAFAEVAGLSEKSYDYFKPSVVSDEFYGTLYSKALDKAAVADEMELISNIPDATVSGNDTGTVYDNTKLDVKDKYAVFFGGNYGELVITTGAGTGKSLLVIKDSFANSMVPYLMEDYDTIVMVDLRYYSMGVSQLIEQYNCDEALLVYEMSNLANDANFFKLQ